VNNPDCVALSKRTGALYVLTRCGPPRLMTLIKFSGWSGTVVAMDTVVLSTDTWEVDLRFGAPALMVTENSTSTNVWVGYSFGFRKYLDNGANLILAQDLGKATTLPICFQSMERVSVIQDRDRLLEWM